MLRLASDLYWQRQGNGRRNRSTCRLSSKTSELYLSHIQRRWILATRCTDTIFGSCSVLPIDLEVERYQFCTVTFRAPASRVVFLEGVGCGWILEKDGLRNMGEIYPKDGYEQNTYVDASWWMPCGPTNSRCNLDSLLQMDRYLSLAKKHCVKSAVPYAQRHVDGKW